MRGEGGAGLDKQKKMDCDEHMGRVIKTWVEKAHIPWNGSKARGRHTCYPHTQCKRAKKKGPRGAGVEGNMFIVFPSVWEMEDGG